MPRRCGNLPFVFESGFGFERYADYVLDVPMYFVYRDSTYHDVSGQSFRDFMKGRLPGLPGGSVCGSGATGLRQGRPCGCGCVSRCSCEGSGLLP